MKSTSVSQKDIQEKWFVIDASGTRIGKIASLAAELLLGKNDPMVRPNLDPKANVVIVNAKKIDFTPKRGFSKFYKSYSGFPGGLKFTSLDEQFKKDATYPITNAVKGMLPKNTRGRNAFIKLRVYEGEDHPHEAQNPEVIDVNKYKL